MSVAVQKSSANGYEESSAEKQAKINEVRKLVGPLSGKVSIYCSDTAIARHLVARNWNVKKATKMLKETLKWRKEYKPDEIRWEDIAHEAQTGKIYRSNYVDKQGRTVLVMRPSCQNTKSTRGQIKFLMYCLENAVLNLPPDQEQMVWLIDFHGFYLSNISVKVARETAHILQDHYPERLGLAILYNPPKFFEPFWTVVKPFVEPKTTNKVKFVYSDDPNGKKTMEEVFDMDQLESAFGGNNSEGFDISKYAERMREDDKRMPSFWSAGHTPREEPVPEPTPTSSICLDPTNIDSESDTSDKDQANKSSSHGVDSEESSPDDNMQTIEEIKNGNGDVH